MVIFVGGDAGVAVAEEWLAAIQPNSAQAASSVFAGRLGLVGAGQETVAVPVAGKIGEYVPLGLVCGSSLTHTSPPASNIANLNLAPGMPYLIEEKVSTLYHSHTDSREWIPNAFGLVMV